MEPVGRACDQGFGAKVQLGFRGLGCGLARLNEAIATTHRPQSSSFLGLLYRIQNMNPKGTTLVPMGKDLKRNARWNIMLTGLKTTSGTATC